MKFNRVISLKVLLLSIAMFSVMSSIFAEGIGEKIGDSLTANIGALIPGIILAIGIYFLVVRDWMKMFSFMAIALLIAIFTNWNSVTTLATRIYNSFLV